VRLNRWLFEGEARTRIEKPIIAASGPGFFTRKRFRCAYLGHFGCVRPVFRTPSGLVQTKAINFDF